MLSCPLQLSAMTYIPVFKFMILYTTNTMFANVVIVVPDVTFNTL